MVLSVMYDVDKDMVGCGGNDIHFDSVLRYFDGFGYAQTLRKNFAILIPCNS